jgi:hypothetical protein
MGVTPLANNMKSKEQIVVHYVLDNQDEINLVKDCLNYCWHRATQHKTPMSGKEKKINELRRQFGIIK